MWTVPDSRFLSSVAGRPAKGIRTRPARSRPPAKLLGFYAPGWDLCAVSAERDGVIDLNSPTNTDCLMLTTNGASNKEPAWFRAKK